MLARDVMIAPVITVKPYSSIKNVAGLFWKRRISGAPVVDDKGKLVGMITEGDLVYRFELKTDRPHPHWFLQMTGNEQSAKEYAKSHGRHVSDVMTRAVITAAPDTPLNDIAALMEKNSIKRIPIVEDDRLIGIVTRANLVQAIAITPHNLDYSLSDRTIREKLLSELNKQPWAEASRPNIIVHDGVVELWGTVSSDAEMQAIRVAAESSPGVCAVRNHLALRSSASQDEPLKTTAPSRRSTLPLPQVGRRRRE
jgi:CBS domain-containing protein